MKRRLIAVLVGVVVLAAVLAALGWRFLHPRQAPAELTLDGNVDLRQVELAFNGSERIAAVLVQEGDRVHAGQVLAKLDVSRLEPMARAAQAQVDAQRQAVLRLRHGNRPEEIAQARANLESAQADAANARQQYDRLTRLARGSVAGAVSQQDLDNAKAALDVAVAKLAVARKALDLEVAGPRAEDVAQAEALLQADEAQAALARQQLADAQLVAPLTGVVRSRLLEPGDMASPQKPAFTISITDPKWVRAYVSEPDLGHVRPGMAALVTVDSFSDRRFESWVGFVSSVAEFTPKPVQTQELRTKLVYEVRVFVKDPSDELRLGMPATVHLPLEQAAAPANAPSTQKSAAP